MKPVELLLTIYLIFVDTKGWHYRRKGKRVSGEKSDTTTTTNWSKVGLQLRIKTKAGSVIVVADFTMRIVIQKYSLKRIGFHVTCDVIHYHSSCAVGNGFLIMMTWIRGWGFYTCLMFWLNWRKRTELTLIYKFKGMTWLLNLNRCRAYILCWKVFFIIASTFNIWWL